MSTRKLRELAAKEKIRQEIEERTGKDTVLDIQTEMLKSGKITATVRVLLKADGNNKTGIQEAILAAFVDLPIELQLKWD
ncbi:hypothetical protein KKI24_25925 [bacterium]|nr:hypothetical protein [bacterium]